MARQRGLILFATAKAKRWGEEAGEEAKGNALGGEACVCMGCVHMCAWTYVGYTCGYIYVACHIHVCSMWMCEGLCLCVLDMHMCCMFVCSEFVCLFSQRVYAFSFSHSTGSPSEATLTFQGCRGYPACTFFSHLPSSQKMIDDSLPFCKQLSPPEPIVRRPRLGDTSSTMQIGRRPAFVPAS